MPSRTFNDGDVMSNFEMFDTAVFDKQDMRPTADGYIVATPRVARTGIQLYRGDEVGRADMQVVRVYRPADQVFKKDSMRTFAYRPITDDHPSEPVTAKNWKDHSVGQSGGEIARDGEFMRVPMVVMDERTIDKVMKGKAELSVGYTCDLKWGKGTTDDGEDYDAIQTNIRANHIAIVKAARGGDKLRIGDDDADALEDADIPSKSQQEKKTMSEKTTPTVTMDVDGISVEMSDIASSVVKRRISALQAEIDGLKDKLKAAEDDGKKTKDAMTTADEAHKKAMETKDAEVVTLKKQLDDAKTATAPEALDKLVKDRAETIGKAKAVLGDKLVVDGKDEADIRKQVVTAKLGDAAKDWSADAIAASFATLTAGIKADTPSKSVYDAAAAFATPNQNMNDRDTLYAKRDAAMQDRWKTGGTAAKQ